MYALQDHCTTLYAAPAMVATTEMECNAICAQRDSTEYKALVVFARRATQALSLPVLRAQLEAVLILWSVRAKTDITETGFRARHVDQISTAREVSATPAANATKMDHSILELPAESVVWKTP